jgi:hypothetical protein
VTSDCFKLLEPSELPEFVGTLVPEGLAEAVAATEGLVEGTVPAVGCDLVMVGTAWPLEALLDPPPPQLHMARAAHAKAIRCHTRRATALRTTLSLRKMKNLKVRLGNGIPYEVRLRLRKF